MSSILLGRLLRCTALASLAGLIGACGPNARRSSAVVTGTAAEARFSYQGRLIHPFCVDFPLEESSRHRPISLAACTDPAAKVAADTTGWHRASFRPRADLAPGGGVGYRVLAARGDSVLLATEQYGRGSGYFTQLLWATVADGEIRDTHDVRGGDRCGDGLTHYVVGPSSVRFDVDLPTRRIVMLADAGIPEAALSALRNSYIACDGRATYQYDPASGKSQLASVTLNADLPLYEATNADSAAQDPQACYVRLVKEYVAKGKATLLPPELTEFGRSFAARCHVDGRGSS